MAKDPFSDANCVLLDIDGTLVDSNEFHVQAWHEAFRDHGHTVTAEEIRSHIGKGGDQLIPSLVSGIDDTQHKAISAAHDELFRSRYLGRVQPFENATAFVEYLSRRGLSVVLASSAKQSEVNHYVELLKIEAWLHATTCADDVERSKPAGDIFATALAKVPEARAATTLVIGDTPYDVSAATKCGIATLAVLSGGFSEERLRSAGARAIYGSVGDILDTARLAHPAAR